MAGPARALTALESAQQQAALAELGQGRVEAALERAAALARAAPDAPDAHFLHAVCLAERGSGAAALTAFEHALALAPDHPLLLVNHATLLRRLGQPALALAQASKAASAAPGLAQAWIEVGWSALESGDAPRAAAAFQRASELRPEDAEIASAELRARRATGDWPGSQARAYALLAKFGTHAGLRHALAKWLREEGEVAEALRLLDEGDAAGTTPMALQDLRSGLLLDLGQAPAALENARRLAAAHPFDPVAQATLAAIEWEHGDTPAQADRLLQSALRHRPGDAALRLQWIRHLLLSGQPERALGQLQLVHTACPPALFHALQADALHALGRGNAASQAYENAHRHGADSEPAFLNSHARHCLRQQQPERAVQLCQQALAIAPYDQQSWAWLGTAWRMLGDAREHWLCDYEHLVVQVPVPWASSDGAIPPELIADLTALHVARRAPANQSLRQGSQTAGKLFGPHRAESIRQARAALVQAVETHLRTLPLDPAHPFLARNTGAVRMAGSWSVRLQASGNHVNHVHPDGWCSSACYVSLPPVMHAAGGDHAGWIAFGEPPVELGLALPPRRMLQPREGWLALFPSYVWHGTVPFVDDAPRLTMAFDMQPLG